MLEALRTFGTACAAPGPALLTHTGFQRAGFAMMHNTAPTQRYDVVLSENYIRT
jgi:hypothetical protein